MKFIELNQQLKTNISHLYNIVGEDVYLIKQAINMIKSATIKDLEEFNYTRLSAEKMKESELMSQILTLPIGNDYRLVVLENPNVELVKVINKLDLKDSSTVLLLINAEKLTVGETVDCSSLDRDNIVKYILNTLHKDNLSIEEQAMDYLIEVTGANMSKINNELKKLIAYAIDEKTINMDMVTNLVSNSYDYVIYMLTNAIDDKDYTKYQTVLKEISKSQSLSDIYSYIGRHLRRMQYISINKNDDELSKILAIKPYALKMSRQKISKNGIKYYINLYQKYITLDYQIKSGEISVYNALYELLF